MSVSVTHLFRISVRTKHMQAPPPWRYLWQRGLHMSDWIGSNVSLLSRCPVPRQTKAPAERRFTFPQGFRQAVRPYLFISSVNRSSLSSVLFLDLLFSRVFFLQKLSTILDFRTHVLRIVSHHLMATFRTSSMSPSLINLFFSSSDRSQARFPCCLA